MVIINNLEVSKKELSRISKRILEGCATDEDFQILSNFRAQHSKIIKSFVHSLRSIIKNKNMKLASKNEIIISQRLKRLPSIINKLKRFENISLGKMQDLAGARVILSNIKDVEVVSNYLKNKVYKQVGKNNFLLIREKDYIKDPKIDGYRSIHQVFRYQGKNNSELKDYEIELQIRTILQHQWATSVEIIDSIKQQSLKSGGGDNHYKKFFKLSSKLIEYIELKKDLKDISKNIEEIKKLDKEYKILDTLSGLRVITRHLSEIKEKGYIILILDYKEKSIRFVNSPDENINIDYLMYETTYKSEDNNVVSVSVENLKKLKKAYPNYFLDAREFVKIISKHIQ